MGKKGKRTVTTEFVDQHKTSENVAPKEESKLTYETKKSQHANQPQQSPRAEPLTKDQEEVQAGNILESEKPDVEQIRQQAIAQLNKLQTQPLFALSSRLLPAEQMIKAKIRAKNEEINQQIIASTAQEVGGPKLAARPKTSKALKAGNT